MLAKDGGAVDSVEAAIRMLEDLPVFNAGRGSVPDLAGEVEVMDSPRAFLKKDEETRG